MRMVIVSGRARAKTITASRGHRYSVPVSYGQMICLPGKGASVDCDDDIVMVCDFSKVPKETRGRAVRALRMIAPALSEAVSLMLTSDADRTASPRRERC